MKKTQQLQQALWQIEQKWGAGSIHSAAQTRARDAISTGFPALDGALAAGGLAAGRLTVAMGTGTSGATTCAYRALAAGQRKGGYAIYVDLAENFDPEAAADCGLSLSHLLIIRAAQPSHGLEVSRDLLMADATTALVIDLSGAVGNCVDATAADRLADAALRSHCAALILIDRDHRAVEAAAHTWLTFSRQAWLNTAETRGCLTHVNIRKDKPQIKTPMVPINIPFAGVDA